jgi:hypothetical protein
MEPLARWAEVPEIMTKTGSQGDALGWANGWAFGPLIGQM